MKHGESAGFDHSPSPLVPLTISPLILLGADKFTDANNNRWVKKMEKFPERSSHEKGKQNDSKACRMPQILDLYPAYHASSGQSLCHSQGCQWSWFELGALFATRAWFELGRHPDGLVSVSSMVDGYAAIYWPSFGFPKNLAPNFCTALGGEKTAWSVLYFGALDSCCFHEDPHVLTKSGKAKHPSPIKISPPGPLRQTFDAQSYTPSIPPAHQKHGDVATFWDQSPSGGDQRNLKKIMTPMINPSI